MSELQRILVKITESKQKGENRLYLTWGIAYETLIELTNMGYLVLWVYKNSGIYTIVGWEND